MYNSPAVSSAKSFDLTSTAFLIIVFLTGIAGALQTLIPSVFLTDEVHARPAMVGFFFTGSAVIEILVSQFLTGCSDKRGDHKLLIIFCCLLGMLACTLSTQNRNYFVLLFVGVFLSSFGLTTNSQTFALARERADKIGCEAVMPSFFLRAQVSLAWVIGPPLAYALMMGFSFTVMYLSAAAALTVCGVTAWLFLSSMQKELPLVTDTVEVPHRNRRDTLLLFVICTLMWGPNSLHIISTSLFIINKLHPPGRLAGVMMGTAAGLEILTMSIAGYFVKRLGKRLSIRTTAVDGVCLCAGMLMAHSLVILLGLQPLNVIFTGILSGIGMLYFQDLMPGQTGSATILYTNTSRVDWIIAGSVTSIVVEIWNYHAVLWFAMMIIIAILFCLLRIKDV